MNFSDSSYFSSIIQRRLHTHQNPEADLLLRSLSFLNKKKLKDTNRLKINNKNLKVGVLGYAVEEPKK